MDTLRFDLAVPGGALTATILAICLAVVVGLGLLELRRDGRRDRARVLAGLRIVTALFVFAVAVQPRWTGERFTTTEGRLAVLVDTSRSMGVAASSTSRAERTEELLRRWHGEAGGDSADAAFYRFGEGAIPVALEELAEALPRDDDQTRIGASLDEVIGGDGGADLGAVVIVSDGAGDIDEGELAALAASGARVHAVAVGAAEDLVDDAIETVEADEIAFLRQAARVRVVVHTTRGEGTEVPVALHAGEELVRETTVVADARGRGVAEIAFVPSELGRSVYRLSIPLAPGDAVAENNERVFLVRVTRDKLRVLLVAGRPSWDERFLRSFLKRDPSIDLISFFILRTGADLTMAAPDEMALIPFPTDELFSEHLGSFDLVFFQNFEFAPYQMAGYLPRIRDYVMRGGGFAMIGGDLSFASAGYGETPIAEILPVAMPSGDVPQQRTLVMGRFAPVVVPGRSRHPLIELLPDPAASAALWSRVEPLEGANVLTGLRGDGQALLTHPRRRDSHGEAMPVLAVGSAGIGRTLAFGTDTSYRWGISTGGASGDASMYERFWDRAIRWLTRDPTLDPAQVTTDRPNYGAGAPVRVTAVLRDASYEPLAGRTIRVALLAADGTELAHEELTSDAAGRVEATLDGPLLPGGYRAAARLGDDLSWLAEEGFVVESGGEELAAPAARPETLRTIAARTRGTFVTLQEAPSLDGFDSTRRRSLGTTTLAPLASFWAFLSLVLLFGVEWVLRRAWGRR